MGKFKEKIEYFIKDIYYIIPLLLTAILSFGFVITHTSVNIDTLSDDRYFEQGMLFIQGRFGSSVIQSIFNVYEFNPFFVDFLSMIMLIVAAITFCMLFRKVSKDKISKVVYTIFSCLFVSYPLINEIFVYTPAGLSIAINYFIIGISLHLVLDYLHTKKISYYCIATLLLSVAIGSYESFASVYLCTMFFVFLLEYIYGNENIEVKGIILKTIKVIIPLLVSIVLSRLIAKGIVCIFNIYSEYGNAAQNKLFDFNNGGIALYITQLVNSVIYQYIFKGMFYLPIAVLVISMVIHIVISIIYATKKRSMIILLLFLGMTFSLIAISLLQGVASPYRTCQVFIIYIGATAILFLQSILNCNIPKVIKNTIIILMFLVVFYQAKNLHHWFYLNYLKYEGEKTYMIQVANDIMHNYDYSKPIYFLGNYEIPEYISNEIYLNKKGLKFNFLKVFNEENTKNPFFDKIPETNVNSYINWALEAFEERNTELFKWLKMLGYDFKQTDDVTMEKINKDKLYKNMKEYPEKGSIIEKEEYILVNL